MPAMPVASDPFPVGLALGYPIAPTLDCVPVWKREAHLPVTPVAASRPLWLLPGSATYTECDHSAQYSIQAS